MGWVPHFLRSKKIEKLLARALLVWKHPRPSRKSLPGLCLTNSRSPSIFGSGNTHNLKVMSSYAIIKTGGKQYKVSVGTKLDVSRLNVVAGDAVSFDQVLFVANGAELKIGDPVLAGASVKAKVLDQHRDKKVIAFKYKKRKGYHRTIGHRRQVTRVEIESINA
jgi:large subunit ribosomal protein L21